MKTVVVLPLCKLDYKSVCLSLLISGLMPAHCVLLRVRVLLVRACWNVYARRVRCPLRNML